MRKLLVLALALIPTLALAAPPSRVPGRLQVRAPRTMKGTVITGSRTDRIDASGQVSTGRTQSFRGVKSGITTTITTTPAGEKTFQVMAPVRPPGVRLGRAPVIVSGPYTKANLAAGRTRAVTEAARRVGALQAAE